MRALSLLGAMLVLSTPCQALAYRRSTVDGAPDRGLFWEDRAIDLELAASSSTAIAPADLRAALDRSSYTWTEPSCSDIVLSNVGDTLELATNLVNGRFDGRNRIVVRGSGWPTDVAPETLALTTVVYDTATGRILDADIDLNEMEHAFRATEPPSPDHDDVENTLTHELGHLLGLAHVFDREATMFGSSEPGETSKRDLSPDDRLAVCETYPTGLPTPSLPPAALPPARGCTASPTRASPLLVLGFAACLIVRARRRSHRRAHAAGRAF